jgi:UDP-N-acetylmuramoyl-L-alanyl-D-glutamate--2,6-diaminopimelate ligase
MKLLRELLYGLECESVIGNTNMSILNIQFNSKEVESGDLFVAIQGKQHDGHNFIVNAIDSGAVAVVCENIPNKRPSQTTYIKVKNSSYALSVLASNFFNNPSKRIKLIGVTGTNGKTSVVYYLFTLFKKFNFKVGLLSTIDQKIDNISNPSTHTTPNPLALNQALSSMVKKGCDFCFMEVSSHAIDQHRIVGLHFDIAVFTNITRDHLDYHTTFNNYINTKKSFFDSLSKKTVSIVNIDDTYGSRMLMNTESKKVFYSIKNKSHYEASIVEDTIAGLTMSIDDIQVSSELIGEFNAYNILTTYSVARELGQDKIKILQYLSTIQAPPGRFNIIRLKKGLIAIVDYAHTPDALKKVILSISNFCSINKDLIIVVGCGGDRDRGKRSIMGQIASENSSLAIFTSDNPRSEDPNSIIDDMCAELSDTLKKKVRKILNREEAIISAVQSASAGSIILIAGKGHEKFQEINNEKMPFDDIQILKNILKT